MSWRDCVDADGVLDAGAAAAVLRGARQAGQTLSVLLSEEVPLGLADAYRVQSFVTAARLANGERRAGWKLGYTSLAMREQMGISSPNFGPLTDAMLLVSPALLPDGALQPRVEPEIGLRLGRRLEGPCQAEEALEACETALACLEIVDSVWSGYRFTLEDNTADGSSAAWVAVGSEMPLDDLAELAVVLCVDGAPVAHATGAAASGHPAAGLARLAGQLAERGQALEAGELVITGGLTSAPALEAGHGISAAFGDGRWSVEVRRADATGSRLGIDVAWITDREGILGVFLGGIVYTKSGFRPDWPEVFNHTIAALLAAAILAVFGTLGLLRPVRIPADRADEFFLNYFSKVPGSSQRHSIYENDFTSAFRSYHPWPSYNSFWAPVSYVDIDQAIPISDNPLEFTINATFHPVSGPSWQRSFDYYLTCDGTIDKLYARIMQCPASHIEIDRVVWLDPGSS